MPHGHVPNLAKPRLWRHGLRVTVTVGSTTGRLRDRRVPFGTFPAAPAAPGPPGTGRPTGPAWCEAGRRWLLSRRADAAGDDDAA